MAYCGKCGSKLDDEAVKFCPACGAPMAKACPQCGTPAAPGAKFCNACGTKL